jgi:2-iminobutanoate/2-iminopropanoate deaminase
MSKKEIKHPDKQVSTGAYSAGVLIDGWLYVAGQGPLDYRTGEVIHGTIEEEMRGRSSARRAKARPDSEMAGSC